MNITVLDASQYFRGLLLLIRKDGKISDAEASLMMHVGKRLGFEREFCEQAIRDILENKHIVDEPPVFSSPEIARCFVQDGIRLALSDQVVHPFEERWLYSVTAANGLSASWMDETVRRLQQTGEKKLDVEDLTVAYSQSL